MSRFARTVAALVSLSSSIATSQVANGPSGASVNAELLETFVKRAFEPLQNVAVTITPKLSEVPANVTRFEYFVTVAATQPQGNPKEARTGLTARGFAVVFDGYVESLSLQGSLVLSSQYEELVKLLRSHPEWQDADVQRALQARGGKFGPSDRDAFLRQFGDAGRLFPSVGQVIVKSAEFRWKHDPSDGGDVAKPWWVVSVETSRSPSSRICTDLGFEPFGGRLTVAVARPCA